MFQVSSYFALVIFNYIKKVDLLCVRIFELLSFKIIIHFCVWLYLLLCQYQRLKDLFLDIIVKTSANISEAKYHVFQLNMKPVHLKSKRAYWPFKILLLLYHNHNGVSC